MSKRRVLQIFNSKEARWDLYPSFIKLMRKGLELEACLLMLATWNFARFRYALPSFKVEKFAKVWQKLGPLFRKFEKEHFKTIDFDEFEKEIKQIFRALAKIKGVDSTGASKLMHIKVPKVFVMWDYRIRQHYGFRKGDADEYFAFLKLMQKLFANAKHPRCNRTLAKLIDEHNYNTITLPKVRDKRGS